MNTDICLLSQQFKKLDLPKQNQQPFGSLKTVQKTPTSPVRFKKIVFYLTTVNMFISAI